MFELLIARVFCDGVLDRVFLVGPIAFDYNERNAVDEENDVRAPPEISISSSSVA
jgi:hypothetical protein